MGFSYSAPAGHASWGWWFAIMAGLLAAAALMLRGLRGRRPWRRAKRAKPKSGMAVFFPKKRVVQGGKPRRHYGPTA